MLQKYIHLRHYRRTTRQVLCAKTQHRLKQDYSATSTQRLLPLSCVSVCLCPCLSLLLTDKQQQMSPNGRVILKAV